MLFYLSCVLLLHVFGFQQGDASEVCPPVGSLQCTSNPSICGPMKIRRRAFIRLNNNETCVGCMVCLDRGTTGFPSLHGGDPHDPECPRVPCYAMRIPDNCGVPEVFSQEAFVGLKRCPVCETFRCPNL